MRRNSGLIGKHKPTTKTPAGGSGVHDTFDNYNARVLDRWPLVIRYLNITVNSSTAPLTLNEGSSFTVVVTTEGMTSGTLYYSISPVITAISSTDFTDGVLSGSFTISNNTGTFTKTLVFDGTSEGDESFQVNISTGSTSGPIVLTSSTITIANPSFSITPSSSSFNEGSSVTWNVATTNVNNGTLLYWSYAGTPANSTDITSSLTGSYSINNNIGSFITTAGNDFTTEGSETLTAYVRVGSTSGTIVATGTVTINDTSLTPGVTITPSSNSVDEGSSVTFTVNTTNFPSGTLSWNTVLSGEMEGSDISATSGTVSISGSTGSIVITATSDGFTETGQTESFQVRVLSPATGNPVLATSSAVTINDTSLTADILIVGGGGGGGHLGGGGAGGHRYFTNESLVPTTLYTVTVGEGGIGSTSATGASGSSSVFDAYTSAGGGGGAGEAALPTAGGSGGGGGGLAGTSRPGAAGNTPSTSPSQGNAGGDGNDNGAGTAFAGGGGGGAGGVGNNAPGTTTAGDGGLGTPNSITGTSVTRAAGGGGGAYILGGTATAGIGGSSIGGNGGRNELNATSGSPNTGSGGGGNGYNSSGNLQGSSGGGGSGVVILKYPSIFNISNPGGGLTSTTDSSSVAGYKITTFTAGTGTISFETPEPAGYTRVAVNKLPTLGTTGHPTYPPVGWTGRQNASADDANLSVTIPTFTINNTDYTTVFVVSNSYLTFGSGSTAYNSLSGSEPALNKIHIGAADNSYQRVSTISSGADYTRIRYEGTASTSGTLGSPNIVWEATFFDKGKTGGVPVVEILVGTHSRTTGQAGIASTSAYYQTFTLAQNTSYVFVGNSSGTSWTIYAQQSMSGTDY